MLSCYSDCFTHWRDRRPPNGCHVFLHCLHQETDRGQRELRWNPIMHQGDFPCTYRGHKNDHTSLHLADFIFCFLIQTRGPSSTSLRPQGKQNMTSAMIHSRMWWFAKPQKHILNWKRPKDERDWMFPAPRRAAETCQHLPQEISQRRDVPFVVSSDKAAEHSGNKETIWSWTLGSIQSPPNRLDVELLRQRLTGSIFLFRIKRQTTILKHSVFWILILILILIAHEDP